MKLSLCISIRFIQPCPLFHGRGDTNEAEWPPSPLRAFQALLNAACLRMRGEPLAPEVLAALRVIEALRPSVIAPHAAVTATGRRAYVPHNQTDLVTAAWDRGNLEASIASYRVEKDFRPQRIEAIGDELPAVHYLYPLDATVVDPNELLNAIRPSVRSIHCLGWGIDQVVADATLAEPLNRPVGESWMPTPRGGRWLRVHRKGSLDALAKRYDQFLNRLIEGNWTPVPPLSDVDQVRYRRDTDPVPHPEAVFKLVDANDDTVTYAQSKLIHVAGMVKHAAINAMKMHPPGNLRGWSKDAWVEAYVAGHQSKEDKEAGAVHAQLSYIPLQSIGHPNADPGVRRVMIVAPIGDEAWLQHLAARLDGVPLSPLPNTKLPPGTRLESIDEKRRDGVRDAYLASSVTWGSVTPVILPGHDDHKPEKTRKLIERSLAQSGIDLPCEYEWSSFSRFPKMLSAHKYGRDKRPTGYIRPDHLLGQTAVHLTLRFNDGVKVPGPLAIGAGRHCGFGLMAACDDD